MEFNEQSKLTKKIETDSQIQRTDWQLLEGMVFGVFDEKGKRIKEKTHRHRQQCGDYQGGGGGGR